MPKFEDTGNTVEVDARPLTARIHALELNPNTQTLAVRDIVNGNYLVLPQGFAQWTDSTDTAYVSYAALETAVTSASFFFSVGGGGGGLPTSDHRFDSVALRDTYFTANPGDLRTGLPIFVTVSGNTEYQIWGGSVQSTYDATDPTNDDNNWVVTSTFTGTAAQIKTLYESNADTNAFTDQDSVDLQNSFEGASVAQNTITLTRVDGGTVQLTITQAAPLVPPTVLPPGVVQVEYVVGVPIDASTATEFPAGASQGNVYRITVGGDIAGESFVAGEFIIALIDSPSTTVFANNWARFDGQGVASISGLHGVLDDADVLGLLDRLSGPWKEECRVATTANITLSGTQTIDGQALNVNDRVLVKNQTDPSENGIYLVAASAWSRTNDFNNRSNTPSSVVPVLIGDTNESTFWKLTTTGNITVGTTNLTFDPLIEEINEGVTVQDEGIALQTLGTTLNFVGAGVGVTGNGAVKTITIPGSASAPSPISNDLRYGLSDQSDPALVSFGTLTDEANPTDPITVSTGTTTSGNYFHIFSANTHDIQTITDTVLGEIVYQDGGSGNIFTKQSDVRTEASITYDSYTIGPLNAGVDESYVLAFS